MLGQDFWGLCLVSGMCPLFAPPGAVPVVGGYLYPSVLRSPGVTPQECRAAHGPLHPAVTNPPRHCWFGIWFLFGFSGMDVGYSVWCFFVSGVGLLSGFVALKDLTPVCPDVCGPLSLFCAWFVRRRRFSLCPSLSQVQKGFGFPLVFLHPGHGLLFQPVRLHLLIHQGHAQLLPFFFFDARVGVFVGGSRCLVRLSVCRSVFRSWWVAACTVNALARDTGQPDYHLAPPSSLRLFSGIGCGPASRGSSESLSGSHSPHPLPAERCKGQPRKGVGDI